MSRQTELAQIHIAKKDLGLDDETYRYMLKNIAGADSSKELDFVARHKVIQHLKNLGWKPKRKVGPKSNKRIIKGQGDKIRALWLELAELDIVRDKSEAALMAYIKRMTKGKYEAPQFCDSDTASRIIETLKKWKTRAL